MLLLAIKSHQRQTYKPMPKALGIIYIMTIAGHDGDLFNDLPFNRLSRRLVKSTLVICYFRLIKASIGSLANSI